MIPPGYAAGEPKENISINQANKYIAKAAKLGVIIGPLFVDVVSNAFPAGPGLPIKQALANGVTNDDPILLIDSKGNVIALADALLKPATIDSIITWFQETGNNNPTNATLQVLGNLPTVVDAIAKAIGD